MHIAEGILPFKQVWATTSLSVPIVTYSALHLRHLLKKERSHPATRSFLTMAFALCFAVTLLPIPVPVAGATSHMCATPLLTLLLGPFVIPVITAAILFIQAIFFAHGGISTLGANVLTLGVTGPLATLVFLGGLKLCRIPKRLSLMLACLLGSLSVYVADSLLLAWSFSDKQPFATTFEAVLLGFLPVQGPLSLLEGVISSSVLLHLSKYKAGLLPEISRRQRSWAGNGVAIILFFFLSLVHPTRLSAASGSFEGLDDALFIKTAEHLGAKSQPLFPWLAGEVELAAFSFGFLICGFIAGRSFTLWKNSAAPMLTDEEVEHAS